MGILCHESINSMINNKSHVHQKLYEKKAGKVKNWHMYKIIFEHFSIKSNYRCLKMDEVAFEGEHMTTGFDFAWDALISTQG